MHKQSCVLSLFWPNLNNGFKYLWREGIWINKSLYFRFQEQESFAVASLEKIFIKNIFVHRLQSQLV